ncbi:hypothetical protein [Streptomyces sp. NPDC054863]
MSPPVPYDPSRSVPTAVTGFVWSLVDGDQAGYQAVGPCPVCGCRFTARWPWGQVSLIKGGGFRRRRKAPDPSLPWPHPCSCDSPHLGRSQSTPSGCGARLKIEVPAGGLPR